MKKNGFTLVELLVSFFIITIISALIFFNYRQGQKEGALLRSAQRLASDLRKAQSMATSTLVINGIVYNYYGLNLSTGSQNYIIYGSSDGLYTEGIAKKIETISLEQNVKILSPTSANINFKAPFGETTLTGALTITLSFLDESKTKDVIIKTSGQIEIP